MVAGYQVSQNFIHYLIFDSPLNVRCCTATIFSFDFDSNDENYLKKDHSIFGELLQKWQIFYCYRRIVIDRWKSSILMSRINSTFLAHVYVKIINDKQYWIDYYCDRSCREKWFKCIFINPTRVLYYCFRPTEFWNGFK